MKKLDTIYNVVSIAAAAKQLIISSRKLLASRGAPAIIDSRVFDNIMCNFQGLNIIYI